MGVEALTNGTQFYDPVTMSQPEMGSVCHSHTATQRKPASYTHTAHTKHARKLHDQYVQLL